MFAIPMRAGLRAAVLILAASIPLSADGGTRFAYTADAPGYTYRGTMTLDGENHRLDVHEGNHPQYDGTMTIITRRSAADALVIDHRTRTWFQRDLTGVAGPLTTARGISASTLVRSRVWTTRERSGEDEAKSTRHVVHAEYSIEMDVHGERVPAEIRMTGTFEMGRRIRQIAHPWALQFAMKTGIAELDRAIARHVPDRLPLRQVVTASRQIAGGEVFTETFALVVSDIVDDVEVEPGVFAAPAGYEYREPVFNYGQ